MAHRGSPPSRTPPCRFPAVGSSGVTPRSRPGLRDPRWQQRVLTEDFGKPFPRQLLSTGPAAQPFPPDATDSLIELPFRIFLGEFSYSVDVCGHIVSSSVSRYVSFQQIRTLASPFPPVGSVAARFRSPAVPHLRRYYKVVRLLQHPSVRPPVDPWLHVPLDPLPEAVLLV